MARNPRKGGAGRVPPGNSDRCPACGSFCSRTEADRARNAIGSEALAVVQEQLRLANVRIAELEAPRAKRATRKA